MDISIIYRDKWLLLCVKKPGILSEGDGMPELLKAQLGGEIYPVHRLDRAVGGLMIFARTRASAAALSALIARGELEKKYLAVIQGCPDTDEGVYKDLLFKDSSKNKSYVVKHMRKGVKEAELAYRVLDRGEKLSLTEVSLHTGRSHQIRVQFSSRKMPLAGDVKYGSSYKDCPIALWSCSLSFDHPFKHVPLSLTVLPEDIYPWNQFKLP